MAQRRRPFGVRIMENMKQAADGERFQKCSESGVQVSKTVYGADDVQAAYIRSIYTE